MESEKFNKHKSVAPTVDYNVLRNATFEKIYETMLPPAHKAHIDFFSPSFGVPSLQICQFFYWLDIHPKRNLIAEQNLVLKARIKINIVFDSFWHELACVIREISCIVDEHSLGSDKRWWILLNIMLTLQY